MWIVSQGSWVRYPVWQHTFVSPSAFSRRAVVSYWRKYVHEVLVNRLGGLSLPRKSVVRLTDRPDMTLDVYRGRKTTMQQQQQSFPILSKIEIKTRKLERKSKQQINKSFKQLIIFLFQPSAIFFGWLHQPMASQDYIDLTRYYVVKSRYLSWINDLISFIYAVNIGKER